MKGLNFKKKYGRMPVFFVLFLRKKCGTISS